MTKLGPFQKAVLNGLEQALLYEKKVPTNTVAALMLGQFGRRPSNSGTYNALCQLERRGLVVSVLEAKGRKKVGARRRRCYKLTAAGRKVLKL